MPALQRRPDFGLGYVGAEETVVFEIEAPGVLSGERGDVRIEATAGGKPVGSVVVHVTVKPNPGNDPFDQ